MVLKLLDSGCLQVTVRYVRDLKGDGVLWYYRRIPAHARPHHGNKQHVRTSLKTRDLKVAAKEVAKLAAADDAFWDSLRTPDGRDGRITTDENREAAKALLVALTVAPGDMKAGRPDDPSNQAAQAMDRYFGQRYGKAYMDIRHGPERDGLSIEDFWTPIEREAVRLLREGDAPSDARLSDALKKYLKGHPRGHQEKFRTDAERVLSLVYGAVGDMPLKDYRREHANKVVEALSAKGNKTGTIRRQLNTVVAVFNRGLKEFDLQARRNPFESLQISQEKQDASPREPFTLEELLAIAKACRELDDDIRHLVALQMDTGARLAEISGLRRSDVVLMGDVPHIIIQPHLALGRTLKNASSQRKVPLVGEALWAAQRALDRPPARLHAQEGWLFPRYSADGNLKATHASNTVNKWLRGLLSNEKSSHGFRHSMRDRLRHADVPGDIQDIIGGWGNRTIGQGYGEGYLLKQLQHHMKKAVLHANP